MALFSLSKINFLRKTTTSKITYYIVTPLIFSWIYAICAQCIIPLPFNFLPLYPHPLPIFLCTMLFGTPAVLGYIAYLAQGICGAPFFSPNSHLIGLARIYGPTGGYLLGFLVSALFILVLRNKIQHKSLHLGFLYWTATTLFFCIGMAQLSFFVPTDKLIQTGFLPFFIGDYFIKAFIFISCYKIMNKSK